MRELAIGIVGNVIAAVLLSLAGALDVRALTPDAFFGTGTLGLLLAVPPLFIAWRMGRFVNFADGTIGVVAAHAVYFLQLVVLGAVQATILFAIAQRYVSGRWCAPDLANALFLACLDIFVFASVLSGELHMVSCIGEYAAHGDAERRSCLEVLALFGISLVLVPIVAVTLGVETIPTFASLFPTGIRCP